MKMPVNKDAQGRDEGIEVPVIMPWLRGSLDVQGDLYPSIEGQGNVQYVLE
jgi:hypothetical protein